MDSINDILNRTPSPRITELPRPFFTGHQKEGHRVGLAVASMKEHMTDEGWQLFLALQSQGYCLCGHGICSYGQGLVTRDATYVPDIIEGFNPTTVVVQDKREWDCSPGDFRDRRAYFQNVEALRTRTDIFKLTVLKDSQQRPDYHRQSAEEIDCHAWITYYHPRIVKHLAPYVREQHLIRTYHSIDRNVLPTYNSERYDLALLSGALGGAYPLRTRIKRNVPCQPLFGNTQFLAHPGYHRQGSNTPGYLRILSQYKVAICTCSIYGYALRKIIEAVACGCRVITNLPHDEVLPVIDTSLVRVPSEIGVDELSKVIDRTIADYNPDKQEAYSNAAQNYYNYQAIGLRLAQDIEAMRRRY